MVNQQKIITMTKLALYDKHDGPADRAASDYFRHDYIYKKNLGTRLAVGFGSVLILVLYWIGVIFEDGEIDIFELDFRAYLIDSFLFVMAVLAVYSLIGTIQGTREYYLVQKRITQYQTYLRHLERGGERKRRRAAPDGRDKVSERRERATRDDERLARRAMRREKLHAPPITRPVNADERLVRRKPPTPPEED